MAPWSLDMGPLVWLRSRAPSELHPSRNSTSMTDLTAAFGEDYFDFSESSSSLVTIAS
jgi:hypothetical protein